MMTTNNSPQVLNAAPLHDQGRSPTIINGMFVERRGEVGEKEL